MEDRNLRDEKLKRLLTAKQKLAVNRNFWVVNAYTPQAKAWYKVVKQFDEAVHEKQERVFFVGEEMKEFLKKLVEVSEIVKKACVKLGYHYVEPDFVTKIRSVFENTKDSIGKNEEN